MRVTPHNMWNRIVPYKSAIPEQLLSIGKRALALVLLSITLPTIGFGATVFQDFENSSSLSSNFTQSTNSSGSFTWSATNGINNSGKVAITTNTDVIYTTKQKYSIEDNGVYTLSALFHSQYNNGYGSFGFTTAATSNASGQQGSPSESSFGVSFHAGGGSWMNNNSLTVLTWDSGLDTNTTNAEWYLFKLEITDKADNTFDLEFWIYDVDQTTGAVGTEKTNHTTTVTNAQVKAASDLYVFFGAQGQRMIGFDNFTIETSDNVTVGGDQVGQTQSPDAPTNAAATAGNAQATVSWTAPASNGGAAITSYTATAVEDNTKSCTTANGSTLTCDVTGLTNGTAYTFTVRATNSAGTSAASTASGCAVIPTGAPSGSSVDANYATVDFSNACNSSIGTGVAAGFEQPYESVLAGVDAVLTVTDAQNLQSAKTNTDGKVSEVDEYFAGNPPGWATDDDGINTEIYSIANTGESLTTYRIDFLRADTLIPITVNNIAITVKDLDDTEFAEFGGINTYTLAQSTSVGVQNSGNNYRFEGTTSETSRSVSSWAEVRYGSANSVTMVLGTTNSQEVGARFGVSFTAASWGNAATNSVTVSESTYTITYDGNGNDAGNVPAATSGQGALTIASNSGGLSKAGVAFNGWNAKNDGSGLALTPGSSYTPSADMTLYAIYPAANSVPGTPTGVTASAGNAQATVSWDAPASNGGAPITGYTVTASSGGSQCTTTGATSCVVTGLTNGTDYTFTVTATNGLGTTSAASSASNSVTPATVPGAPTIGTATAGNAQASVTWTAPADNGGAAVTSYTATAVEDNTKSCSANGSTLTCTITGLTNGSAYTFTVTATNAAGTSAASAPSNSVTPEASSVTPATPVPVLSLWALWIFSGLLGLLGLRRLSQ